MRLFFERFDILLSPVLPVSSLDAGLNIPPHLADRNLVSWVFYTYPFNLTGQPAAAVCAAASRTTACPSDCRSWGERSPNTTWYDSPPHSSGRSQPGIIFLPF